MSGAQVRKAGAARSAYSEESADRIRAYLASMVPLRGNNVDDEYYRGRVLIERLALGAKGMDSPRAKFSAEQCADVLYFIHNSEPLEPSNWWKDPKDLPSHVCGFVFVLTAVEEALRVLGRRS